ncbi:MAG TPA: decaprenylphospho-beta-D-erythro-pentofuranosid-2-ulose 2-reductase [Phycicoccus sp.]|nr:decaprenylphospho-beta-D-erythro-pentofuranosid-2-ulose 2-reductase [Phycicoccus sp.]HQH06522.1 decaprenylphospho-beta-D-erythro-pentofuranosid-2-ulose 2-reductase [Phycicoccus sp.]HQK31935.1 decaprenylphospho-beta-D-erythro-pentofuranosid-2-ulose 2-reductase [Phycicoccus sp.]HQV90119.1 decaprenylphospho-beta-D-erythro-pentofuranosid-2-ulose 2-reductase [Phycicoccus sp.]
MRDGLGRMQRVVVIGGSSAIAVATAARWARAQRGLEVVLCARPSVRRDEAAEQLAALGAVVELVDLDVEGAHAEQAAVMEAVYAGRDVDVVLVAVGVLGDQEQAWQDPQAALRMVDVNTRAPIVHGVLASNQLRRQGHGSLVLISTVAGERVRRSNFVYGATKAGADDFYRGLAQAVAPEGVHVLVVRPGFVRSPMTDGLDEAPLAQTPEEVAEVIAEGVREGREVVWAPAAMRWVMTGLRSVPTPIFRKLPI